MNTFLISIALLLGITSCNSASQKSNQTENTVSYEKMGSDTLVNFENETEGKLPSGFVADATNKAKSIKWNAPSFRTSEFFATMHLRAKNGVQLILHFGAKKRADLDAGSKIADPESILEWLAADRAVAKFRDLRDIAAKRTAFTNVIRQWITHV